MSIHRMQYRINAIKVYRDTTALAISQASYIFTLQIQDGNKYEAHGIYSEIIGKLELKFLYTQANTNAIDYLTTTRQGVHGVQSIGVWCSRHRRMNAGPDERRINYKLADHTDGRQNSGQRACARIDQIVDKWVQMYKKGICDKTMLCYPVHVIVFEKERACVSSLKREEQCICWPRTGNMLFNRHAGEWIAEEQTGIDVRTLD